MKKNTFLFGTISGLIISTFMGASMALMGCSGSRGTMITGMIVGFSAMIAAFSFVFVGIKNYRDKQNGGALTFGKGLLLGVLISFVASTMYTITWAVEYHFFLPDFMDKYAAMKTKELQTSGLTGAAYDEALKKIESNSYSYKHNLFYLILATYKEIFPVGILVSLISALILRRKPALSATNN